jgi:aspartate/methionine/tyrosine aminotransferase
MRSSHLFYAQRWLSDRALHIRELYPECPLYHRAKRLGQQGEKVINVTGNSADSPPPAVREALQRSLASGLPYPELRGLTTLREAIAEKEAEDTGRRVDPSNQIIVFGGGAMQALNLTLQATVNPGEEVIVLTPSFPTDEMIRLVGGKPVFVPLNEAAGFKPDLNRISEKISRNTKMIILNTPHNPSGYVWQRDELRGIAEIAMDNDILVLSDGVFKYFVFDGLKQTFLTEIPGMEDNTISICSATKSYAMFSWRVSWMIANKYLIRQAEKIFAWNAEFAPPITQVAAEAAIRNSKEWMKDQTDKMQKHRDILFAGLTRIDGFKIHKPEGGPTVFPDISHLEKDSMKFASYLLEKAKVLVAPGIFYLGEGHIRMAIWGSAPLPPLTEEDMHEAVNRLREAVPKYDSSKYAIQDA